MDESSDTELVSSQESIISDKIDGLDAAGLSILLTEKEKNEDAQLFAFMAEEADFTAPPPNTPVHAIARQDLRVSAEKILYTFLLPGSEREIVLPHNIVSDATLAIEDSGRDDPEVFDTAKDYVYQAMERDAFPGFLNLSRPLLRVFRGSKTFGLLVNRLSSRKEAFVPAPSILRDGERDRARIPPEELFRSLGEGRSSNVI